VSVEESARLVNLFATTRDAYGFAKGIELVLQAMLQSPNFLYRLELGGVDAGAGVVALSHHEMASRLSYFLWGTMPDDELFAAAEEGHLGPADEIVGQAKRMLADPRAREGILSFHEQWLRLPTLPTLAKDPAYYPSWDSGLAGAMKEETLRFVEHA